MSEIIVLDTHIWFWMMTQDFQKFPDVWRDAMETAPQVGVSAISCYEIALAHQRGRLELPCPLSEWLAEALLPSEINLLPLTPEIAIRAVNLSPIHKDPFDRIIIATAIEYKAKLASIDNLFPKYPELKNHLMN
jgi:PIN domain nuclease of toxin-antitoxin system